MIGGGGAVAAMAAMQATIRMSESLYPYPRYMGRYDGLNRYEAQDNHRELVRKIDEAAEKAAKKELGVTVKAESIRDAVESAYLYLNPKADKYLAENEVFHQRLMRVRDWQKKKQEAKKQREKDRQAAEAIEVRQRLVREEADRLLSDRKWWQGHMTDDEALRQAELSVKPAKIPIYDYMLEMWDWRIEHAMSLRDRWLPSAPKKPNGFDSLTAIIQLREAISLAPDGVLQIPVDMIRAIKEAMPENLALD